MFFEGRAQRRLQVRMILELIPMVQLATRQKGSQAQWYSAHVLLHDASLEVSRYKCLHFCINHIIWNVDNLDYARDQRT
jgi:hypothetical protein